MVRFYYLYTWKRKNIIPLMDNINESTETLRLLKQIGLTQEEYEDFNIYTIPILKKKYGLKKYNEISDKLDQFEKLQGRIKLTEQRLTNIINEAIIKSLKRWE